MTVAILKQFKSESGFITGPESNFGAITATQLDVDNIRINANSITATNTSGNINLVTTGTGSVVIDKLAVNTVNAFSIVGNLKSVAKVEMIQDENFALITKSIDLKRFFPYWNAAQKTAFQKNGGIDA